MKITVEFIVTAYHKAYSETDKTDENNHTL